MPEGLLTPTAAPPVDPRIGPGPDPGPWPWLVPGSRSRADVGLTRLLDGGTISEPVAVGTGTVELLLPTPDGMGA